MADPPEPLNFRLAADWLQEASSLLIGAGAGLGVDSGLPDFRGNDGFWRAYPAFRQSGLSFIDLANPVWFDRDPSRAWGFYGHRLTLYRRTMPHPGFRRLKHWGETRPGGHFVFTSNVDGQFQKAGFAPDRIVECHGSIHHLQCSVPCSDTVWPAEDIDLTIDERACRASGPFPVCPRCGAIARPNILMFCDGAWVSTRTDAQMRRYWDWLRATPREERLAIECGAGGAIPTVRRECETRAPRLIRINLREAKVTLSQTLVAGLGFPTTAQDALEMIASQDDQSGSHIPPKT